jgi:hypothetical protein
VQFLMLQFATRWSYRLLFFFSNLLSAVKIIVDSVLWQVVLVPSTGPKRKKIKVRKYPTTKFY